jgi:putative transposase
MSPQRQEAFHSRKRPVWLSWRMDEAYIGVKGHGYDRDRAMNTSGQAIDFLLTAHRDEPAAKRFLTKAIRRHCGPEKVTIDGSEANAAASRNDHVEYGTALVIRQVQILAQDPRTRSPRSAAGDTAQVRGQIVRCRPGYAGRY